MNPWPFTKFDFKDIRPARGRQDWGFEELCVQLFRGKFPSRLVERVEGSGGDGGLEAYWVDERGGVVGMQAKYYAKLGDSEFKKIRNSAVTARRNYPTLKKFIVGVPHDRNPSQLKKWGKLVSELQETWKTRVVFEWWGISQISNALLEPCNATRANWWFGCKPYTREWLATVNSMAFGNLHSRYTPDRHIKVDSEAELDAFIHSEKFLKRFDGEASDLANAYIKLRDSVEEQKEASRFSATLKALQKCWRSIEAMLSRRVGLPNFGILAECISDLQLNGDRLASALFDLNEKLRNPKRGSWESTPLSTPLYQVRHFRSQIEIFLNFLQSFRHADSHCVLLVGEAGTGKSHLIANWVKECGDQNRAALMMLGESFLASHHPLEQLVQYVGWPGTVDELLAALSGDAEANRGFSVICIDAVNESSHRSLWRSHLLAFAARISQYPNLRLLVSCRSDFTEITLPPGIGRSPGWSEIEHRGFGGRLFDAVKEYFGGYRVSISSFPLLLSEFQNPLFLKTVCEAFEGEVLPSKPLSLDVIMRRKVTKAAERILIEIDCPTDITESAIDAAADAIRANRGMPVPIGKMRSLLGSLFPATGDSVSLYRRLISHGLLVESASFDPTTRQREVFVRFPYERFSDHFIARKLLDSVSDEKSFRKAWDRGALLSWENRSAVHDKRGILRALAVLLPERFGIEIADLKVSGKTPDLFLDLFLESLMWRDAESFGSRASDLVNQALSRYQGATLLMLLSVATVPNHPFNGDYLHVALREMKLPERESAWTIFLSNVTSEGGSQPDLMVRWALQAPMESVSDEQALTCATAMAWFFTSNHQAFRYRATLAVIRLLQGRLNEAAELVRRFSTCDDPYVTERVQAVAAGVAMRERTGSVGLRRLAQAVFDSVFAGRFINPHVLLRDYASCVVEVANVRGCLPSSFPLKKCRPPYKSSWPSIPSEEEINAIMAESDPGWSTILESLRTEGMRSYGDFGRYVMGTAVHEFSDVGLEEPAPDYRERRIFSDRIARCWILHRIRDLGWTPELFQEYEDHLPHRGRQRVDIEQVRLERISKKYQWIALRELQGFLLDHFHHSDGWQSYSDKVCGAWGLNLVGRNFDPSQPLLEMEADEDDADPAIKPEWWLQNYPDPFIAARKQSRKAWVDDPNIADLVPLIDLRHPEGSNNHLALTAEFYQWCEPLGFGRKRNDALGEQRMWVHFRSWLIPNRRRGEFIEHLQGVHFWGEGLDFPDVDKGWLGEYPWAQSFSDLEDYCKDDRWIRRFRHPVAQTACKIGNEGACRKVGLIPSPQLLKVCRSSWDGTDLEFSNEEGVRTFTCEVGNGYNQSGPLIARKDKLIQALARARLSLVWTGVGERSCWNGNDHVTGSEGQFSAVYWLDRGEVRGGLTRHVVLKIPAS